MPPPNRSQSSPNLRTPSSPGLDSRFPLHRSSMASPEPFAHNASFRRFNSRRPRPTVASIADIFVGSLVIAGYCHEHSPRGRGLSTLSMKTAGGHRGGMQPRRTVNTRQLSRQRLEYLGSPAQRPGVVQHSKTYQMFSSGVAQRVEDDENEPTLASRRQSGTPLTEQDLESDRCEDAGENTQERVPEDSNTRPPSSSISFGDFDRGVDDNSISENEMVDCQAEETNEPVRHSYKGRTNPRVSLLRSTKKLFAQAFGESLDRDLAVRSVIDNRWIEPRPPRADNIQDATDILAVQKLLDALWDEKKSNHYIFRLYRDLPHPGVACLSKRSRGTLLRRFANPPNRRWVDARRYLALVEDMIVSKLPMSRSLWSSAIHLAGRASGNVIKADLVRSIGIWQQMEHLGGIRGDGVVFTILFDIAIKAGQFTVADRLVEEMTRRKISFGRTGKVSKIYYHGLLQDAEGIHRTFDEFVSSGEIVDTAVLNCLLVSFLRAGEAETAEQLYRRMIHGQKTGKQRHIHGPGYTSEFIEYRDKARDLNQVLQLSSALRDQLPEHHRALQQAFPMVPDTRTFHILLSHHAYETGSLESFMSTLKDMEMAFTIPPRGMIYLLLFDGFANNGRKRKGWTPERLQETWRAYLAVLYESRARFHERFYKPGTLVWQNPLESGAPGNSRTITRAPSGLYTPLPSNNVERADPVEETPEPAAPEQTEPEHSTTEAGDEVDADELLGKSTQEPHPEPDHLTVLERQIENGVFLGRRMIIIILRAFGTCCGPKAVMEVWLRMEKLWQPQKRKALDVQAVREELDYQMNRRQS
ncbi:pentatricopeptide repeat protein [Aspergillus steynii IBT 23096]|uniref:Pentatricopeptide repeat protein n=1 Tax=Aspergillus steynii IBT 23096 TaxID=1392250 RepID=A0A2I2GNH9_9EURO|nr:pentatricopeptide repeat protein [Aspergillus steynii IBT 23096]PLB54442.1 pentatricopeptide repeat protein [Aspergillus steynii IBT 23096]